MTVTITHGAVMYLLMFLDALYSSQFTDCTGSCLLVASRAVCMQYCGNGLKSEVGGEEGRWEG